VAQRVKCDFGVTGEPRSLARCAADACRIRQGDGALHRGRAGRGEVHDKGSRITPRVSVRAAILL